jgi:hypothetical protein
MATRSTIALEFADGTVGQVYCHWDGYIDHNGKILFEHYADPFKLRDLIDQGDLSSLGPNIGEAHPFSPHGSKEDEAAYEAAREAGYCTFYARDRGEEGTKAKSFKDFEDYKANHQYEEYEYILCKDGNWYVCQYGKGYELLSAAIQRQLEEA